MKRIFLLLIERGAIRKSGLFDKAFYLRSNPDVARAGIDPIVHFMIHGWKEGRKPSKWFDVEYYLSENPDVADSGQNPLIHYIRHGKAEGRKPREPYNTLSSSAMALCRGGTLIFDHNAGGGTWRYLYNMLRAYPSTHGIMLIRCDTTDGTYSVQVRSDRRVKEKDCYEEWESLAEDLEKVRFSNIIINSLYSWPSAKSILHWIESYKKKNPDVQVEYKGHDYYCVCPSFTLQDAKGKYCGIRCDEIECADCVKQSHVFLDEDHVKRYSVSLWRQMWRDFFANTVDVLEVFSPSSKEIFTQAYPFVEGKIRLIPHQIESFSCCNIAILGHLIAYKGADVVKTLCQYLDDDHIDDMRLYLFGENPTGVSSPHLKEMGSYQRSELPDKLEEAKIHAVFIPSTCPETFCYTAGESIALGYPTACFDLGGQADQVRASDKGMILYSDEPDYLYTMLKSLCGIEEEGGEKGEAQQKGGERTRTVVVQDTASRDFLKWMYAQRDDKSHFVEEAKDDIRMRGDMPKVIATYLPQFHEFPENTRWFGKGFSEWTNTTQTLPQFVGHRQPHVPIDVGYYNLNNTDAMHRQAELARKYGVAGFSVYYYWFSGKKLMDKPMKLLLEDKTLDFPFFFFWANDDWSMSWGNGAFRETLYKGGINAEDAEQFMADVLPYMRDSRYMKIGNKPILLIYKVALSEKEVYDAFVGKIQEIARENGFDGLYLISPIEDFMDHDHLEDAQKKYALDALVEFHPIAGRKGWNLKEEQFIDPNCQSACYDVDDFISNRKYLLNTRAKVFPGLFPDWDNTPRRYHRGAWILQNTPQNYKKWLADLIDWTRKHNAPDEQFIFVNAWNEWAEGAHLEPDTHYGYAYLQMTREALEESARG